MELAKDSYRHILAGSVVFEHLPTAALDYIIARGAKLFFLSREEFRNIAEGDARVGKVIYLNLLRFLITRLRAKDEELDLFMMGSL
jgi:hypothetical protein